MCAFNTSHSYGVVTKFFHWLIFILVIGMLTAGYFLGDVPKDWQRTVFNLHKLTGLTLLCLVVLRFLWSLINKKPVLPASTTLLEKTGEGLVHGLLYLALIAMPLVGWIGSTAGGRPPHLGSWIIALPIAKDNQLKEWAFDWHGYIAIMLITLISVHILAALYHHFIRKDDVLKRMLPGR